MIIIPAFPIATQQYMMNPSPLTGFMMGAAMSSGDIDPTNIAVAQNIIELTSDKKRIKNVKIPSPSTNNTDGERITAAKVKTVRVLVKMYNESSDEQERKIIYQTIEKIVTN